MEEELVPVILGLHNFDFGRRSGISICIGICIGPTVAG